MPSSHRPPLRLFPQNVEFGDYLLKQQVGGHPVSVYRFPPRMTIHPRGLITVWSGQADPLQHQPPMDFVFLEQRRWGTGPECTTILCKGNGQVRVGGGESGEGEGGGGGERGGDVSGECSSGFSDVWGCIASCQQVLLLLLVLTSPVSGCHSGFSISIFFLSSASSSVTSTTAMSSLTVTASINLLLVVVQ